MTYIWRHCHVHDINVAATASAACVTRLGEVADWWRSSPMANTLACLCSCQWWIFLTWTVKLFSLYFMKFMFHTTLDAVGNILRVHYKTIKCDASFSQGSVSTLFRWGEHVFHVCVNIFFLLIAVQKLQKIKRVFPELWSQMYCRVFYEPQCHKCKFAQYHYFCYSLLQQLVLLYEPWYGQDTQKCPFFRAMHMQHIGTVQICYEPVSICPSKACDGQMNTRP